MMEVSNWDRLSSDLTEQILSLLPIPSIIRSNTVCKTWHSVTSRSSFTAISETKKPWFFLFGMNNISHKNNQAFAFDPDSYSWIRLPSSFIPQQDSFTGSGGYFFATCGSSVYRFTYAPLLTSSWRQTPPLKFSRCDPLVGVFRNPNESKHSLKFLVVGGVRFIGGLVDIEERLAVEIYDQALNQWELCPPLPHDFRTSTSSSQWLCSALFRGNFYVFGIYSGFVSSFDLNQRIWSEVQTLHPPGVLASFLVSCGDQLILAGLCNSSPGFSFNLWTVDVLTLEFTKIAIMPQELLHCLIGGDEDEKFASLKCVGLGNMIYIFSSEHHRMYPACVCEIKESNKCIWKKIPNLPMPINPFHKVIAFCSPISLSNLLQKIGGKR